MRWVKYDTGLNRSLKNFRVVPACGKPKILELLNCFEIETDLEKNETKGPEMKGDAAGKVLYCPFLNYQGINNLRRRAHIVSVGHLREGLLQTGFPFPLARSHWLCLSDSDLYPRVM